MRHVTGLSPRAQLRREGESPVRPLLAALPQIRLAGLVLVVGFAAALGWPWVLATACSLVVLALLQAARAELELGRRRRAADEWLVWGGSAHPSSALLRWRTDELTSPQLRSTLAHSLRRIEREARGGTLPGPVPLNTRAIRSHLGLVRVLRERLEDRARPVSARGMVLVDRLLTEAGSPLYSRVRADDLAEAIGDALAAIDPFPAVVAA